MNNFFIALAAIIILGGGWYWYSMQVPAEIIVDVTPITVPVTTPVATTTSDTAVKEITITNAGMTFTTKTLTVKKGDRVKVTYQNTGGTHDLRIDGYNIGTKVLTGTNQETFEFVADEAGSFEYFCSVGNHRAMGMKGTLTVTN